MDDDAKATAKSETEKAQIALKRRDRQLMRAWHRVIGGADGMTREPTKPSEGNRMTRSSGSPMVVCGVQGCTGVVAGEVLSDFSGRWLPACRAHLDEAEEVGITVSHSGEPSA